MIKVEVKIPSLVSMGMESTDVTTTALSREHRNFEIYDVTRSYDVDLTLPLCLYILG